MTSSSARFLLPRTTTSPTRWCSTPTSGTDSGDTTNATRETGEPTHIGNGANSVWYSFTPDSDGSATFDTIGSSFNTVLAAYTGSAVDALSLVASDDDGGSGFTSSMTFDVTGGTTYSIAVAGFSGGGSYTFNWDFVPVAPAPVIQVISPSIGAVGSTVSIEGSGFAGATSVKFNGANAEFTLISDTHIDAVVPDGATDGPILVTTPGGSAESASFDVDLVRFEESDGGFAFGSGWRSWVKAGQSGGAAEISNVAGSSMSVVFSGDVVRWIGQRGPTRAMASVVIDGVELGPVDTYWPSYVDQQVLFAAGGLGSGDHVLTITWEGLNPSAPAGSYVVVDAIEAAGTPVLSRFEESDGGFWLGRVGGRG